MNRFSIQKKIFQFFIFIALPFATLGQTRTVIAEGNWDDTNTWQLGTIADVITEDVDFSSGDKIATVRSGFNYTVGVVALGSDGKLAIEGTLNIGQSGTPKNLTASDGQSAVVSGTLIIWGDLIVSGGMSWTISGTVIIKGNVSLGNGSTFVSSGNLTVNGSFTAGDNTSVTNSGIIDVDGPLTVGTGSVLVNSGTFTYQSCSGPATFCPPLPISLTEFASANLAEANLLTWTTATEINFDRFEIERSLDGIQFYTIGQVSGAGYNIMEIETHYSFEDKNPVIGKNYYRLKAVDLDQYFEYSKVIMVNWKGSKNISLYPSPSDGSFIALQTNFNPTENEFIQIFDNLGVKLEEFKVLDSKNKLEFRSKLLKGNYLLRYVSDRHHQVIKFSVK